MAFRFRKIVIERPTEETRHRAIRSYERMAWYTATEDGNPATAHNYASRQLAARAMRTYVHADRF